MSKSGQDAGGAEDSGSNDSGASQDASDDPKGSTTGEQTDSAPDRPEAPPLRDGPEEETEILEEAAHRASRTWVLGGSIVAVIALVVVGIIYISGIDEPADSDSEPTTEALEPALSPAQGYAKSFMKKKYDWGEQEFNNLDLLWERESNWNPLATGPGGAYGIPQALPGSKMKSKGADWKTNPRVQIRWGLQYIHNQYGTPTKAWNNSQRTGGY